MTQSMTLLQRGVIVWLREDGYSSLADAATHAWSRGERCNLPNTVHTKEANLRAAFDTADGHALDR